MRKVVFFHSWHGVKLIGNILIFLGFSARPMLQFKWFFTFLRRAVILIWLIEVLTACGTHVHHRVEKGESLYSIGFFYGQDYQDIAQWNNIEAPYVIKEGQWIKVAPPAQDWWEDSQSSTDRSGVKNKTIKSNKPEKKQQKAKPVTKQDVVTEDFTDSASRVGAWIWPTAGKLVKTGNSSVKSNGIKIEGNRGQPIVATAAGKVVYSGSGLTGYGKLIIIKHNKYYLSAYAHNDKMLVREGEMVRQGQKIAMMGSTRDNHALLHFEIRENGKPIDPLRLLVKRSH